ncbi:MAG: hypothetical protein WCA35_12430, partial [Kovacikia sp.]
VACHAAEVELGNPGIHPLKPARFTKFNPPSLDGFCNLLNFSIGRGFPSKSTGLLRIIWFSK